MQAVPDIVAYTRDLECFADALEDSLREMAVLLSPNLPAVQRATLTLQRYNDFKIRAA
jgi:hypothetical protein